MEVSDQLHAPAAFILGWIEPGILEETGWVTELKDCTENRTLAVHLVDGHFTAWPAIDDDDDDNSVRYLFKCWA
jgi:hypothetical protein